MRSLLACSGLLTVTGCVRCVAQYAIRVRVYANCRVRRIFFSDRLYNDWELPQCLRVKQDNNNNNNNEGEHKQQAGQQQAENNSAVEKEQLTSAAVRVAEVMVL